MCHPSFSLHILGHRIFRQDKDGQGLSFVLVGHGYGSLVLKQVLVGHAQSGFYRDLRSYLCGIVFYGGTNTKLTNKHGPMLMENKGGSLKNLATNKHGPMLMEKNGQSLKNLASSKGESFKDPLISKIVEDQLLEDTLSVLSERFEAALDLKKVKVCVVNENKSFLQVLYFLSILQLVAYDMMCTL